MPRPTAWLLAALTLAAALPAQAAGTSALVVSATVLTRASGCWFNTGQGTLPFGAIDPSTTAPVHATTTIRFSCIGLTGSTTYSIQAGDGSHSVGAGLRRMRHTTTPTEFMPYSLSLTPASGTIPWLAAQTITVNGTVNPIDFQNARLGNYSDTVLIQLVP